MTCLHSFSRKPMKALLQLYGTIAAAALCSLASANEPDSAAALSQAKKQLQDEIRQIEGKIRSTDSLTRIEAERFRKNENRLRENLKTRENEIAGLSARGTELQDEIRRLTASINQTRIDEKAVQNQRAIIAERLVSYCADLEKLIARTLPWEQEKRRDRVAALRKDIANGSAPVEEGFSRLMALITEEISFGDNIALGELPVVRKDGSVVNARVLRAGNIGMVYMDTDEKLYGILEQSGDSGFIWREECTFTEREEIRTAVRVKDAKKAPQVVLFPTQLRIRTKGEVAP